MLKKFPPVYTQLLHHTFLLWKQFDEAFKQIGENTTAITALQADLKAKYDQLVAKDVALAAAIKENKDLIASAELRIETLESQVKEIKSKLDEEIRLLIDQINNYEKDKN